MLTFGYTASGSRAFKREGNSSTLYAGLYEMRIKPGDVLEHVMYIQGGSRVVGQITRTRQPTGELSEGANFYTLDHLGTVATIVDQDGAVIERSKTDPFGQLASRQCSANARDRIACDERREQLGSHRLHGP